MEPVAELDHIIAAARDAAEGACTRGEVVELVRDVAGAPVAFRVVGPALAGHLLPAFEHLPISTRAPVFTTYAWDARSSSVAVPRLSDAPSGPAPARAVIGRGRAASSTTAGRTMFEGFDQATATGWFAIDDVGNLTTGERGAPFRLAIHWWLTTRGLQFAHGGSVGLRGTAVLVVGPTGAGKSSTTLACVEDGFDYLADDYCAVDPSGPIVHSLYSSAKIVPADARRYETLEPGSTPSPNPMDDKTLLLVHRAHPARVVCTATLGAIVVPARSHRATSRVARVSSGAGLRALAPSTVGQFPGGAAASLSALATLSRAVPSYRLELGTDRSTVPTVLRQLIARLETP